MNESGKGIAVGISLEGNPTGGLVIDGDYSGFDFPEGDLFLWSSAINENGIGIIGGEGGGSLEDQFAATVAEDGTLTVLSVPEDGAIFGVDINDSNVGVLGGDVSNEMYAAFVSSTNEVTAITLPSGEGGDLTSVAINEAGVALLGGEYDSEGYAALVAPNGTVTQLSLGSGIEEISSVALGPTSGSSVLDLVTPDAFDVANGATSTQFAAVTAIGTRFVRQNKVWNAASTAGNTQDVAFNERLLAYNSHDDEDFSRIAPGRIGSDETPNAVWFEPFANFLRVDQDGTIPNYENNVWGGILGYDYQQERYLIGTAGGYAYNDTKYPGSEDSAKIHQGMLSIYGAAYWDHFWFGAALWGSRYYLENERQPISLVQAEGKTHGWVLSPHLEIASPWALDQNANYHIEPFAAATWVKNWQDGFTETGSSGLNLVMPRVSTSVWQLEAGLKFYERFGFQWGEFRLEEKISYVNQNPTGENRAVTSFVGSESSFPIAIGSSKVQNMASGQVIATFVPQKKNLPYGGFSGEVTGNGDYQSYYVSVFIGGRF